MNIMKIRIPIFFIIAICMSDPVFCQDTSQNQKLSQEHTYQVSSPSGEYSQPKPHIYRDTRLGGSSPLYNTYKKNDNGAGAITNNPNKSSGEMATYPGDNFNSTNTPSKIYRDTRLGSSSPLYNTYRKNDYGAGAITTNPNKGSGDSSPSPYIPDSTTNGK